MGATTLLVLIAALVAVNAQPVVQNDNQNFVPGVFISADTLKDLQQKAQQNQNPPITNQGQPITNSGRNVQGISPNQDQDLVKVGSAYQPNSSPQNNLQSQPTVISNQPVQTVLAQPAASNQATVLAPAQPQVVVAQPVGQPSNQAIVVSQPNQAYLVQQPGNNQPVYLSQPAGTQYVGQPNQQVLLSNGQLAQVIVANGQPLTNGQPFVNNGQPFVNNGQPFVNNGQPLLVSTNPGNNQILIQGARQNPVPNPNGVQYAVVPVGQNNNIPPNTNLANGNTYYMVPSTNQVYAVNG